MRDYLARQVEQGRPIKHVTRHLLGLFQGQPGGRIWRRYISEHAHRSDTDVDILDRAFEAMQPAARRMAGA